MECTSEGKQHFVFDHCWLRPFTNGSLRARLNLRLCTAFMPNPPTIMVLTLPVSLSWGSILLRLPVIIRSVTYQAERSPVRGGMNYT